MGFQLLLQINLQLNELVHLSRMFPIFTITLKIIFDRSLVRLIGLHLLLLVSVDLANELLLIVEGISKPVDQGILSRWSHSDDNGLEAR